MTWKKWNAIYEQGKAKLESDFAAAMHMVGKLTEGGEDDGADTLEQFARRTRIEGYAAFRAEMRRLAKALDDAEA